MGYRGIGASHILQEILTIKSDDVIGRAKAYESIVKGENMRKPNIPESFNVLVHELRGSYLKLRWTNKKSTVDSPQTAVDR